MQTQNKCEKTYHVKKGDEVQVISGSWKKESGKIIAIVKKTDRVVLEMKDVSDAKKEALIGKRTVKKSAANPKGGRTDRAVSVHVSNVKKKG